MTNRDMCKSCFNDREMVFDGRLCQECYNTYKLQARA